MWRLYLVDNGNKDHSFELCNHWQPTSNRIKVYHKENGGQASARNYGLNKCAGDM